MKHRPAAATLAFAAAIILLTSPMIQVRAQTPAPPAQSATGPTATASPTATTAASGEPRDSNATPVATTGALPTEPVTTAPAAVSRPPVAKAREAAAPSLPLDPRSAEMAAAYQIGPEDILDISVWKNLELSRVVPVRPDGKVSLPLVNDIQAAGLTPDELRDQISTRLGEYIPAPEVSVMVKEVHSRKIAVVGAVKMPGRYELRSPMTVLEAIALAQGLTDFASRDKIQVIRSVSGKTTYMPFNYRKAADGAQQENFFVRPGDIVIVP